MDSRSAKAKKVLERIRSLESSLERAREYLETGNHADWHGFRPLFVAKRKDGRELPPHPDWVRNVLIPRLEKSLRKSEDALERLEAVRS